MDAAQLKLVKVKTGSLKRNVKDLDYAEKELAKEQGRMLTYEMARDEEKMHQQKKVVDEYAHMIPIVTQRLQSTLEDAQNFAGDLPPPPEEEKVAKQDGGAAAATGGDAEKKEGEDGDGASPTDDTAADKFAKETRSPGASTVASSHNSVTGVVLLATETEAREQLRDALELARAALRQRGIEVQDVAASGGAGVVEGSDDY